MSDNRVPIEMRMESLRRETNVAYTQNGAISNASSLDALVDFFGKGGSVDKDTFLDLYRKAYAQNPTYAVRILFYMRDVRGGQGVRDNFRAALKETPNADVLIDFVPEYGRWDDLYALAETKYANKVFQTMFDQLQIDMNLSKPTLLAKWLKSENTSSPESRRLGRLTRKAFDMTPRQYRKTLSELRNKLNIVEREISSNNIEKITYEHVPSQAMKRYYKLFFKKDEERFQSYLESVKKGEKKINASTLYPHQIAEKILTGKERNSETLDLLWDNLPDYIDDYEPTIAVVDTSGSMERGTGSTRPIDVSVSLGLYFAERNKGPFKDYFITFSERPQVQKIQGDTLTQKIDSIHRANWGMSTNFQAVFQMILEHAVKNNIDQKDMIKRVFVISDMQFNSAEGDYYSRGNKTNFQAVDLMYEEAGYKRPDMVFWNVNGDYGNDTPVTVDDTGTLLVSGYSPSILKHAMNSEVITPLDIVMDVVESDRYRMISL